MGRILLVCRLAVRDLRRRRAEAALLLLAVMAATTTLTLGLVLRDAAEDPYQDTRAATEGPDIVASAGRSTALPGLEDLANAPEIIDHSGPYPVAPAELRTSDQTSDVQAIGRDTEPATVDQPKLIEGEWIRDGGVVLEAAFANALETGVGDPVTLNGRSFEVVGVAVTAAMAPYPGSSCIVAVGCAHGTVPDDAALPEELLHNPGLVWLTPTDMHSIAADDLSYVMNLRITDPDEAPEFVEAHHSDDPGAPQLKSWQELSLETTELARDSQILLLIGAWLLGLLAVASLSVLVGGRMAAQIRRVGLLKAIGGTPGLVAAVLLAEHLLVAVVAAAAGLVTGALAAPLLAGSSAGLIGSAGTPSMTWSTIAAVTSVALAVAAVATVVPAMRAARSSTVSALADAPRPPRRMSRLIAISTRMPIPLLLALRIAARRPRRAVLSIITIAVTVSGIFVALVLNAFLAEQTAASGYDDFQVASLRQVLLVVLVTIFALAAVNAIVITWATALDNRHASALMRALGATSRQVSTALAAAQLLPALIGAVIGVFPGGYMLFAAINAITGGDGDRVELPPLWQLLTLVSATVFAVAALTAVPARLGGRRPVTETL